MTQIIIMKVFSAIMLQPFGVECSNEMLIEIVFPDNSAPNKLVVKVPGNFTFMRINFHIISGPDNDNNINLKPHN